MKIVFPLLSMCVGVSLMGCQTMGSASQKNVHEYDLSQQCPSVLEIKVGQSIQVKVDENVTTGYQWRLLQPVKNLKVEETYITQKHQPMIVGAGGEKVFRFTATQQGDDVIQLIHVQGWASQYADVQWQCQIRVSA